MIENFIKNYEYYQNVSLKKYNTYKLESHAEYLIFPKNIEELINLLKFLKKNHLKYLILGGGSNVILARSSFKVVIKLDRMNNVSISGTKIIAEAGASLVRTSNLAMENALEGLAFAGGIPGLVGASACMNAGAYKEDMSMIVKEVKVLDPSLNLITMSNEELDYSYRSSYLKLHKEYICVEVTFQLKKGDRDKIKEIMDSRRERRISSQPLDKPSAGSVFRNPENMPAGKIIEDLSLKGYRIGGASISEKHANFIVNTNNATYNDIIKLIDLIKERVYNEYKIDLILEQEIIR